MLQGITSIDGSVFFDENGSCYGIGYILDGAAIVEGRTDRGARYNSAYTYIANLKQKVGSSGIAVVISEDKTINIFSTDDDFIFIK